MDKSFGNFNKDYFSNLIKLNIKKIDVLIKNSYLIDYGDHEILNEYDEQWLVQTIKTLRLTKTQGLMIEKSYRYCGTPFVFLGSITLAATAGLGAAGQLNTAFENSQGILIGVGGGLTLFYFGKLLRLIGFRFGRDIIYEDFDRLSRPTKKLILESIQYNIL